MVRGCRLTSGSRRWTAPWRTPTTSRSRSRPRSAVMRVCRRRPRRRPRQRRRRRRPSSSRPSKWRRALRFRFGPPTTVPAGPPPGPPSPSACRPHPLRVCPVSRRLRRLRPREPVGGSDGIDEGAAREPLRATVSPEPLAADLRSADDRDLPSRTDAIGAALSQVIGGPVGRHALIGRARFLTPLRVMLIIALVFLALGYSTKAACLQTYGSGTADQRVANWAEPTGLLRAVLLRHRSALYR